MTTINVDITKIAAASFMPGLQNAGQITATALINGTLQGSPAGSTSNMTGDIIIPLPDPTVVAIFRVNFPNADGQLASRWFPLFGTVVLEDIKSSQLQWTLIMYLGAAVGGRDISFNFVNNLTTPITFTNWPIDIVGHLFTYPW